MTRLTRLLTLIALTGACASTPQPAEAAHAPYSLRVEDAHGRRLPSYYHRGQTFVLGQVGERYVIRITNHTARRVEAVVSVDGRDVLSGDVADFSAQRGYVVAPYDSITIDGFRRSLNGVATFRFASPGESYSSRMGTPQNVGVIGAAFFDERRPRRGRTRPPKYIPKPHRRHHGSRGSEHKSSGDMGSGAADAPSAELAPTPSQAPGKQRSRRPSAHAEAESSARDGYDFEHDYDDHSHIGTEYGEYRHSAVREVRFVRRSPKHPTLVSTLRYDDARGLTERGIALYPHPVPHGPRAFPVNHFAPPPPPRRRY